MATTIKIYPPKEGGLFSIKDSGLSLEITIDDFNQIMSRDLATLNSAKGTITIHDEEAFFNLLDGF